MVTQMIHESKIWKLKSIIFAICVTVSATAHAQQRPLVTEDPETIGSGRVLLEGGFSLDSDQTNFANGVKGDIARLASFGVSVGISPTAEVQIDGGLFQRLNVTERLPHAPLATITLLLPGDHSSSMEDLIVATKIRLASETRRVRPSASGSAPSCRLRRPDNGVGLGTTDFFASFLIAKTVQSVRTVGNVGLIVLGNPETRERSGNHARVRSLGRACADQRIRTGGGDQRPADAVREDRSGRTESRGVLRFAGRYTYAMLRLDFGLLVGMTNRDPSFGISGGATYVITR